VPLLRCSRANTSVASQSDVDSSHINVFPRAQRPIIARVATISGSDLTVAHGRLITVGLLTYCCCTVTDFKDRGYNDYFRPISSGFDCNITQLDWLHVEQASTLRFRAQGRRRIGRATARCRRRRRQQRPKWRRRPLGRLRRDDLGAASTSWRRAPAGRLGFALGAMLGIFCRQIGYVVCELRAGRIREGDGYE
jgi:hypothetical protein